MKLSFSTLSFEEYDIDGLIDVCKRYGYEGFELRSGQGWGRLDMTDEELADARRKLDAAGLKVVGIGSSLHIRDYQQAHIEAYRTEMRMAKALGAPGIRIMVGTYRHYRTEALQPMDYEGAVKWMQEACDMGAEDGISLYIEAHNEYCTGEILRPLLDDINRSNCKVIWDILHPLFEGEDIEKTYKILGDDICHLHMKDGVDDPNPASLEYVYTPMGKGTVPLEKFIEVMEKHGRDVFYSLEWEPKWKPELQVLNLPNEGVLEAYPKLMRELYKQAIS